MRREGPECEAQDRIRDAPGEHPAPLLTDQLRFGHRSGRHGWRDPGEFPAFDDAHEWWRDTEAIRISRNGLGAKPVIILPTGDGLHGLANAIEGEVDSEPKFYSRRTIFSDTGADSESFLCVFDQRPQIDKYCAKIPAVRR